MKILYLRRTKLIDRSEDRASGKINFEIISVYVEDLGDKRYNFFLHERIYIAMTGVNDKVYSMNRDIGYELLNVSFDELYKSILPFADQYGYKIISLRNYKRLRNLFLRIVELLISKSNLRQVGEKVKNFGNASSENQFIKCEPENKDNQALLIANFNILIPTSDRVARYDGKPACIDLTESIYLLVSNKVPRSATFQFTLTLGDRQFWTLEEAYKRITRGLPAPHTSIEKMEYNKLREYCVNTFRQQNYRIIPGEEYNIN